MSEKPSNPKDVLGINKAPLSTVPTTVLHEMGIGMLEGALKYGRHNYRAVGVRSSVYYDAAMRHLNAWWEGEDIDPESGLSHITKLLTTMAVLRDSMIRGNLEDDRPPSTPTGWLDDLNARAAALREKYKDRNPKHYTQLNIDEETKAPKLPTPTLPVRMVMMCDGRLLYVTAENESVYATLMNKGFVHAAVEFPTVVYHTNQRPGPGSTSPIDEEIKARKQ